MSTQSTSPGPPEQTPEQEPTTRRGWARVGRALQPRATRSQLVVALLFVLLGFALAVQVASTQEGADLATARTSDLVRILDDLGSRAERLQQEANRLEGTRDQLRSGVDQQEAALAEARARVGDLAILAGTAVAIGPGLEVTVIDPDRRVDAATLLDLVQELRDAGAEAMEIDGVRIVASTSFVDAAAGVMIDDESTEPPYDVIVIGNPTTMSSSLAIPGGVLASLSELGARAQITAPSRVVVDALKPLTTPEYARPVADDVG